MKIQLPVTSSYGNAPVPNLHWQITDELMAAILNDPSSKEAHSHESDSEGFSSSIGIHSLLRDARYALDCISCSLDTARLKANCSSMPVQQTCKSVSGNWHKRDHPQTRPAAYVNMLLADQHIREVLTACQAAGCARPAGSTKQADSMP